MEVLQGLTPFANGILIVILALLVATVVFSISIKSKYGSLIRDINDRENRNNRLFKHGFMNQVVSDYKDAVGNNIQEINTLGIIEKNIHQQLSGFLFMERFVKKAVSLMIILGLLGTFYGLLLSIGELVSLLTSTGNNVVSDPGSITVGLISAIQGMSVAFLTSMVGIGASVVVNLFGIMMGLQDSKESLVLHAEEYLDNSLNISGEPSLIADKDGRTPLELSFETFNGTLKENFDELTSTLSYRLTTASKEMANTANSIQTSMVKFESALDSFSDNTRDFSEFNHHLKNNIQRMGVSFDDLTSDIKVNTVKLSDGYTKIDKLANSIESLAGKMDK